MLTAELYYNYYISTSQQIIIRINEFNVFKKWHEK